MNHWYHQEEKIYSFSFFSSGAVLGGTEAVVLRSLPRDQYLTNDTVPDWCNLAYNTKEEHDEKSV